MSTPEHVVVVGGGTAAGNAVVSLGEAGWGGHLTVLAAEPHPPYERPLLSEGVLASDAGLAPGREARQQPIRDPVETRRWGVSQ